MTKQARDVEDHYKHGEVEDLETWEMVEYLAGPGGASQISLIFDVNRIEFGYDRHQV
jgi:hypothetical protein